jgi:3-hydroxybutyryl-CoA dehydrogenase
MSGVHKPVAVAVVGAGVMGAGIAQVLAVAGHRVAVHDPDPAVLRTVPRRVAEGLALVDAEAVAVLDRLALVPDVGDAVADAGLVIEAGPERLPVKREIFRALAGLTGATLASNTSAIPIGDIARGLERPEQVIGTHFWNPPSLVPLVEVVQAPASDPVRVAETMDLLGRAGMKPVHVAVDVPGFIGNRLQHALKREAIALVANGVCSAEAVDTVTRYGFGARLGVVGPLEQADLSGLELTLAIHEVLMPALDTTARPHPLLVEKVRSGETGAAAGRGFRAWGPGEADARRAEVRRELAAMALRRKAERQ